MNWTELKRGIFRPVQVQGSQPPVLWLHRVRHAPPEAVPPREEVRQRRARLRQISPRGKVVSFCQSSFWSQRSVKLVKSSQSSFRSQVSQVSDSEVETFKLPKLSVKLLKSRSVKFQKSSQWKLLKTRLSQVREVKSVSQSDTYFSPFSCPHLCILFVIAAQEFLRYMF